MEKVFAKKLGFLPDKENRSIKKVSLEALANALAIPIEFESRRKKVQRFLSYTELVSTIGSAVGVADREPYWNAYWGSGRSGLTLKATLMSCCMLDLLLGLTQVSEFASYLAQLDLDYYVKSYVEKLDAYIV